MKLFVKLLVLGFAGQGVLSSTWFSKAAYNKWHETELERWLSDNNIPHPTPADRKELENLVKENWQAKVATPYNEWDSAQLSEYLKQKGLEAKEEAEESKEGLIAKVQASWYETEEKAEHAWSNVKDWIFDSWSDSQLKLFCDKHGIPVPQPRERDVLLQKVRYNYEIVAKKTGEAFAYPGNWLYETWSDSDLKEWLDSRGIPVPQPTTRDKLIASVRRNSRLASLKLADLQASLSASAAAATESLSDAIFEAWSDSELKAWADKNGINVPQGSKRNELLAIVRRHRAKLSGDTLSASAKKLESSLAASAASAYGAATSKAGNEYAKATDDIHLKNQEAFHTAVEAWSESRLKAYLDARGIPVPQNGKKDELIAAVRLHAHKAASGWSAWTYDTWTYENLKAFLIAHGNKAAKKAAAQASASRDDLLKHAQAVYAEASKASGPAYASVTSYLAKATDAAKESAFETWSDSDVKAYLDTYGFSVPQGTTSNQLRAYARNQANWFRYGTTTPQGTLWAKIKEGANWMYEQLSIGAAAGRKQAAYQGEKVADAVVEGVTYATDRAEEEAQKVKHKINEEL